MHKIGLFLTKQSIQREKSPYLCQRRHTSRQRQCFDAKPLGARIVEQRACGADTNHLVPTSPQAAHQGQQEMPKREIDIRDFDDEQIRNPDKKFFF